MLDIDAFTTPVVSQKAGYLPVYSGCLKPQMVV
jgi:hypothetical protein